MGSEQNESFPRSESILCSNGCGFFGTASNMNLCSKCYRDWVKEEEQTASAKAAMEMSLNAVTKPPSKVDASPSMIPDKSVAEAPVVVSATAVAESSSTSFVADGNSAEQKPKNRCCTCNKKVGLTGFKCKCGYTFCSMHRYPEKHECSFDFKKAGQDAIAKANPIIKADKLERF